MKEGAPLIRYRTRDLSRILPGECPCGSRFPRLDAIAGRTDDMIKIKGVNVFPAQIEEVLREFPEVSSEYQLHVFREGGRDAMCVRAEAERPAPELGDRIAATVKARFGFTPRVRVMPIGGLPRSEKKAQRVIDERYT